MFQQTLLIGNIGQDAEVATVGSSVVAKFSVATKESWRDKNGDKKEATEWHNIELWGKQAEAIGEWLEKGRLVLVMGKITTQTWKDKDGNNKHKQVIRAADVKFLSAKPEGKSKRSHSDGEDEEPRGRGRRDIPEEAGLLDDDIPF